MISTVASRPLPQIGLLETMQALFPSGSVTGAPKIRTMGIIAELEDSPRQIYTGCLGFISPGPEAVFNVAIRTLLLDTHTGVAELGVGSGITYDSLPEAEYQECLLKAQFLSRSQPEFELLETILYDSEAVFFLLDRHLARLADSADYFGFRFDESKIRVELQKATASLPSGKFKVRLLLDRDGKTRVAPEALASLSQIQVLKIAVVYEPVDSRDVFLFHKTTHREIYETRKASRPHCDDVLLVNERGELTESTIANLVIRLNGKDYTPPIACGLLAGTLRAELLEQGVLCERILRPEDLQRAEGLFLINSVRGWTPIQIIE
jgi:para-aminobenzoate synthetase/4-amino-4-deoxychorismate lyase